MMLLCKKNLTPLQRRSARQFAAVAGLTAAANGLAQVGQHHVAGGEQPGVASAVVLAVSLASLAPVVLAAWVAGRYLRDEPDEFVRWLVVRSLLWGAAVTMAGDAVMGAVMTCYGVRLPLGLLNVDLFLVTTGIAFRVLIRSYR